ncbi:MAG: preprotein translocase subunit SecG [Bacteroidota bacterium]
MLVFLMILVIIASILLIFVVLVQNPKGGGLNSNFSSQNQVMGVRRTTDVLEKATWILIGAIVLFSFLAAFSAPKKATDEAETKQKTEQKSDAPAAQQPAAQQPAKK